MEYYFNHNITNKQTQNGQWRHYENLKTSLVLLLNFECREIPSRIFLSQFYDEK